MVETRLLDDDIVRIYALGEPRRAGNLIATLFWGDSVRVSGKQDGQHVVELSQRRFDPVAKRYVTTTRTGALPGTTRFRADPVLKVRFVDVGQGDAAVVETPRGRVVLIDGGAGEHLRRYVNVAYSHVLRTKPLTCDAIVVTHGDADHFAGLTELATGFRSKAGGTSSPLIAAKRVFHNGLVKATTKKETDAFGQVRVANGETYAVDLAEDLTAVADARMNTPFREWKQGLQALRAETPDLVIRRLEYGQDDAFDFLDPEISVRVLGPITDTVNGKPALRFLRTPGSRSLSSSHTINGHSIVLKLTYGNVRFLFGADLNDESEERLLERAQSTDTSLTAEVLKVPHHGSADFSPRMLEAIKAVVSVISSGDESVATEYIHPRAGLVGALGRYSRATVEKPLIYVTEMVAFFQRLGTIQATEMTPKGNPGKSLGEIPNAYRKLAFGIVHVRTDGQRVLVVTHSGKDDQKESYAFTVDGRGDVALEEPRIL